MTSATTGTEALAAFRARSIVWETYHPEQLYVQEPRTTRQSSRYSRVFNRLGAASSSCFLLPEHIQRRAFVPLDSAASPCFILPDSGRWRRCDARSTLPGLLVDFPCWTPELRMLQQTDSFLSIWSEPGTYTRPLLRSTVRRGDAVEDDCPPWAFFPLATNFAAFDGHGSSAGLLEGVGPLIIALRGLVSTAAGRSSPDARVLAAFDVAHGMNAEVDFHDFAPSPQKPVLRVSPGPSAEPSAAASIDLFIDECAVCLSAESDTRLEPCLHASFCYPCAVSIARTARRVAEAHRWKTQQATAMLSLRRGS